MATKTALARERQAAEHLAEMTRQHFEKLPESERRIRLNSMKNLRIRNRKTSKRSSTPASLRERSATSTLKGSLSSDKGKGMTFAQIREAAAKAARKREGGR